MSHTRRSHTFYFVCPCQKIPEDIKFKLPQQDSDPKLNDGLLFSNHILYEHTLTTICVDLLQLYTRAANNIV